MGAAKKALGICVGGSTIKLVELNSELEVERATLKNHECNPRKVLVETLNEIDLKKFDYVAITGRKFKELVDLPSITEPEAIEYALSLVNPEKKKYNALISLGSESFILYALNEHGHIMNVQTGNKCASGTGEFFLQQIRRMNVDVNEAIKLAKDSKPHRVSGRCSVFCKSDCTHALNKGVPIGEVCTGLCHMMAEKVKELLKSIPKKDIILVGGVTNNSVVMDVLKKEIDGIFVPKEAGYFEALGAALYAMKNKIEFSKKYSLREEGSSFTYLPPLVKAKDLVTFKEIKFEKAWDGDACILGLDVGSTTTKAVILRIEDNAILAQVYLRTNGDPVGASINCYKSLKEQIGETKIKIVGLGTTGSGRHIVGLHALTDGIINEIIAHATAAVYFDKDVDTIFEIGGQDAKYTYITNSVASDYAMNEACSAGTGSFLEEAAKESLGIDVKNIAEIALKGKNPPNFNDQCAAFISSDIKNASHEGIPKEDIVAGLVYSICMNYANRVKGSRPVGKKIFMQGGVCYNKAVPLAMASLIKKPIIVPPEPGLMGAFGVALEVKNRISLGLLEQKEFVLKDLIARTITYEKSFICPGGSEKCDRGCEINMLRVGEKVYPFGGACNKYYNLLHHISADTAGLNFVRARQQALFNQGESKGEKTVGISRAFMTNTLYPFYFHFFTELGMKVVLSDEIDIEGSKKLTSSFCYPAEIAHGFFANLVKKNPDYIFMPQIHQLYVKNSVSDKKEHMSTCITMQSEPYYLRSTFEPGTRLLIPVLDFYKGWGSERETFISIGEELGFSREESARAHDFALKKQEEFFEKRQEIGKKFLEELEKDSSKIGIVLFGRSYNAYSDDANMGIPNKFASRGVLIVPHDCLPIENEACDNKNMNWATGQDILKAAAFVKKNPQLFGAYITNFSCGPDSFLVKFFRDIMKTKPSLTLELDSHTADAGINTRIEAFLDIIDRYRKIHVEEKDKGFIPARVVIEKGEAMFVTSGGEHVSLKDKRVHLIFPSMGRFPAESAAALFAGYGIKSNAVPVPDFETLMLGRGHTSCKECMPLILTVGSLLRYIRERKEKNELLVYFMPTTAGSCRFSQYAPFIERLIQEQKLEDVALLSLTAENSYAGLPAKFSLSVLRGIIIADVMDDIRNALYVLAVNRKKALEEFEKQWRLVLDCFEKSPDKIYEVLEKVSENLKKIELKRPLSEAKVIELMGEIYVRRDEFSCKDLQDRLAKRDIIMRKAPILEWVYYTDYLVHKRITDPNFSLKGKLEFAAKRIFERKYEKKVKAILSKSGLCHYDLLDIEKIMEYGKHFMNERLTGEAIIGVGGFMKEIIDEVDGVISIGPFGCMPSRVVESILAKQATLANKEKLSGRKYPELQAMHKLPFLALESDGNPFPQIVEARIEAFCLQVERLHEMKKNSGD